jgi:hypothetical protein
MLRQNWGVDGVTRRKKAEQAAIRSIGFRASAIAVSWVNPLTGGRSGTCSPGTWRAWFMWRAMHSTPASWMNPKLGPTSDRRLGRPSGTIPPGRNMAVVSPEDAPAGVLENATPDHFSPSPGRKFWNEIEAPASTRYVSLQVRLKDGTVSAVQTYTVPPE